jgi:hypothetical protein
MQVLVQRVEVAAGVLPRVPVKHKLHALSGLEHLLLLLLCSQVLLLDELQLTCLLALLQ